MSSAEFLHIHGDSSTHYPPKKPIQSWQKPCNNAHLQWRRLVPRLWLRGVHSASETLPCSQPSVRVSSLIRQISINVGVDGLPIRQPSALSWSIEVDGGLVRSVTSSFFLDAGAYQGRALVPLAFVSKVNQLFSTRSIGCDECGPSGRKPFSGQRCICQKKRAGCTRWS